MPEKTDKREKKESISEKKSAERESISENRRLSDKDEDTEKELKDLEDKAVEEVIEVEEKFVRKSREELEKERIKDRVASWKPKTKLGRKVKDKKIKNIDEILDAGENILEEEVVDSLINLNTELLAVGQSKGKFGGGKRRIWRQTQKKTKEGNIPTFSCVAIVGDENGHVGLGVGRAKETLPAREKAIRKAKLNIIKVERGCGSFDCSCKEEHSIPFKVEGKCGSSRIVLMPAPQGTGLVIGDECKKILKLAGIKDIYSKTFGQTRTTLNLGKACIAALKKTNELEK